MRAITTTYGETCIGYQAYLQSLHWGAIRMRVAHRHRCDFCGDTPRSFEVHHKTYDRVGREEMDDLMLVCPQCHEEIHGLSLSEVLDAS
jgi:5-methylcytosine-specific restriction endonuclease McrA